MAINYARLVEPFRRLPASRARATIREAFQARALRVEDIDLGRLFEECYGTSVFRQCRGDHGERRLVSDVMLSSLREAEGAVSTSMFQGIAYQLAYQAVMGDEGYANEDFVFTALIPEEETKLLDGEKEVGLTPIGDEIEVRNEGDPYKLAGPGVDWTFSPALLDRGLIIPLTWEVLFMDKTGKLVERCREVGYWGGVNREKRAIDAVIDENTTRHRYNWQGTVLATYGDNSGTHSWDNLAGTNALVDKSDLQNVENLANTMVDPFTGEPLRGELTHLVVTKDQQPTAEMILHSTMVNTTVPGFATTANPIQMVQDNPFRNRYEVVSSRLLATRLAVDTDWFLGNIPRAVKYKVAERANVIQAPPNMQEEFHRRIVQQFRFNERGAYVVRNPRYLFKSTVA